MNIVQTPIQMRKIFVQAQIHFFAVWLMFTFSLAQFISSVERKTNCTIEQQKCKGHKNCDRLLVSNVDFNIQISQRNEKFT